MMEISLNRSSITRVRAISPVLIRYTSGKSPTLVPLPGPALLLRKHPLRRVLKDRALRWTSTRTLRFILHPRLRPRSRRPRRRVLRAPRLELRLLWPFLHRPPYYWALLLSIHSIQR